MPDSKKWLNPKILFLAALLLGDILLLTFQGSLLRVTGAMILLLLPGLTWVEGFAALGPDRWVRLVIGLGLSYMLVVLAGLLLHFIPGATPLWMILLSLNILSMGGIAMGQWENGGDVRGSHLSPWMLLLLALILLMGAILRFYGLGYSEFQPDETKPLISAAESLEGNEDALFINRKKGPGEILIPVMLWRLTGTINEFIARTPVALAGVLAVLTIYVVTAKLLNQPTALMAAGLMALNGFMVGFSRIIQYQQLVIWMSLLALLTAWEWRKTEQLRWGLLTAVFLSVGLLFHYDTILVAPALGYLLISKSGFVSRNIKFLLAVVFVFVAIIALFLLPFVTHPQAGFTAGYVGGRIGEGLLNNNLFDFYHYTTFYNSFYYVVITGFLLLGFLLWAFANSGNVKRSPLLRFLLPVALAAASLYVSVRQTAFYLPNLDLDLAFLPFALILLGAFVSPAPGLGPRVAVVWLATSFLGYNFIVADPRTHFYTISPAWVILAALAAVWLWQRLALISILVPAAVSLGLVILFSGYLYIAFLRQEVEFRADWPASLPALYWTPFTVVPRHHFGFVHNAGWKLVGGLYTTGQLNGRFATNSESGLFRWYTRQALWGCSCCLPHKYYLAFDYKELNQDDLFGYEKIGRVELSVIDEGVTIYQVQSSVVPLDRPDITELYQAFDQTATPAAFVWPRGDRVMTHINFADLFQLVSYEIIFPQPHPGQKLALGLNWQRGKNYQPVNFNIFVQLKDSHGNIVAQVDDPPDCGRQHTSGWPEGEIITDAHLLPIPPEIPPGPYTLFVGMHLPGEDFRLPIVDETGQPGAEVVKLGTITIE